MEFNEAYALLRDSLVASKIDVGLKTAEELEQKISNSYYSLCWKFVAGAYAQQNNKQKFKESLENALKSCEYWKDKGYLKDRDKSKYEAIQILVDNIDETYEKIQNELKEYKNKLTLKEAASLVYSDKAPLKHFGAAGLRTQEETKHHIIAENIYMKIKVYDLSTTQGREMFEKDESENKESINQPDNHLGWSVEYNRHSV